MDKKLRDQIIDSKFANKVLNNVSPVYDNDLYNLIVFNSIGHELDLWLENVENLDLEVFPQYAEYWLLEAWADTYGIRTKGDRARWLDLISYRLTYEQMEEYTWEELMFFAGTWEHIRRKVLTKIRETSPITKSNFAEYLEDLTGYRIELTHFPEDYYVTIHVKEGDGGGLLLEDLAAIIEQIIPAHVGFFISLENIRWIEFDSLNWTWDDLDNHEVVWEDFEDKEKWLPWFDELNEKK